MLKKVEKSPNWDTAEKARRELRFDILHNGYPYNEGFPKDKTKTCEVILRNGDHFKVWVDTRDQYRDEGICWITPGGERIEKGVVAGWKVV